MDKHFTCDDGSGTFVIQFHVDGIIFTNFESGPWTVLSGEGAYGTLHGTGDFSVVLNFPIPTGTETFTGLVHFD